MSFIIFSTTGLALLIRYLHVAAATIWVGSLLFDQKKQKLVASVALITGLIHMGLYYELSFFSNWGLSLQLGSALGFMMWLNTFVNFKNARFANLMLAVPTLFFMEAATHLPIDVNPHANRWIVALSFGVLLLSVEIYLLATKSKQINNWKKSLFGGLFLLVLLYFILEFTTK